MAHIKILIADDHAIVRMGLSTLLGAQDDFEVVGEASNGEQAVSRSLKLLPDIVIMDLMMPRKDGIAATAELRERLPSCRSLILTSFGTPQQLHAALQAGAAGILLKSTANSRLVTAIRRVAAGKTFLTEDVEQLLNQEPPVAELSPRQQEILASIMRGLTNNEIAIQLNISAESVKTHVAKLYEKIGAANRSEAVAIALRKNLLTGGVNPGAAGVKEM